MKIVITFENFERTHGHHYVVDEKDISDSTDWKLFIERGISFLKEKLKDGGISKHSGNGKDIQTKEKD